MSKRDDGGTAYPSKWAQDWTQGMSLRDYFAGQALNGVIYSVIQALKVDGEFKVNESELAEGAYQLADAMIAEREKS